MASHTEYFDVQLDLSERSSCLTVCRYIYNGMRIVSVTATEQHINPSVYSLHWAASPMGFSLLLQTDAMLELLKV